MIMMIGNQTSGDTGLKRAMKGVIAAMNVGESPQRIPMGMAMAEATRNPVNTQKSERMICFGSVHGFAYWEPSVVAKEIV